MMTKTQREALEIAKERIQWHLFNCTSANALDDNALEVIIAALAEPDVPEGLEPTTNGILQSNDCGRAKEGGLNMLTQKQAKLLCEAHDIHRLLGSEVEVKILETINPELLLAYRNLLGYAEEDKELDSLYALLAATQTVPCKRCDGDGYTWDYDISCPDCNGRGRVPK